jgi:hypothetical protein
MGRMGVHRQWALQWGCKVDRTDNLPHGCRRKEHILRFRLLGSRVVEAWTGLTRDRDTIIQDKFHYNLNLSLYPSSYARIVDHILHRKELIREALLLSNSIREDIPSSRDIPVRPL